MSEQRQTCPDCKHVYDHLQDWYEHKCGTPTVSDLKEAVVEAAVGFISKTRQRKGQERWERREIVYDHYNDLVEVVDALIAQREKVGEVSLCFVDEPLIGYPGEQGEKKERLCDFCHKQVGTIFMMPNLKMCQSCKDRGLRSTYTKKAEQPYNKMPPGLPHCIDHDESHTDCPVALALREKVENGIDSAENG